MRLEDALLYLILEKEPSGGAGAFCEAAIAGGVDVIHLGRGMVGAAAAVREVCCRNDALFIVSDDPAVAVANKADGTHISDASEPVGQYRAIMGDQGLVGVSTHSRNDALLALEMGVDYLLHWEGAACGAAFATLPGAAGNALFAAGLAGLDDARAVVDSGIYRLCIDAAALEGDDVTARAAAYSRILGRSIKKMKE